ncbi:g9209 [Coccomyxa elongata]
MGTNLRQSRSAAGLLVCALLLLPCIVPTAVVDAKRRAAHTKHHGGAAAAVAAAVSSGPEEDAFDTQQVGGMLEEDEEQVAIPLEVAEQHFHLMPARPEVEEEDGDYDVEQLGEAAVELPAAKKVVPKGSQHPRGKTGLPHCTPDGMGQVPQVTGSWVDHPNPEHIGLYDPRNGCPEYAEDFNCLRPYPPAQPNPDLAAREFRKVFLADQCQLRQFDAAAFQTCFAGRRLFLIGDSLMRQQFASLACLLKGVSASGKSARWDLSDIKLQGDYVHAWGNAQTSVAKQFVGEFTLNNGAQVIIRSFGTYQAQLWDDIFAEFAPITEKDVILVNFGAWYPRFKISEPHLPWVQWQNSMTELFVDKLASSPAQVIWKDYSPSHFCGATGTFNGIDEGIPGVPPRAKCEPASVGEFWYGDWIRTYLNTTCGEPCAKIRVLPIFDLSLARYDSHHGSFGRGRFDDKATDCRHFCNNVVDVWNTVFYNMMCPA